MNKSKIELSLIFKGLPKEQQNLLFSLFEIEEYPTSRIVFNQGEKSNILYILRSGKAKVLYKPYDSEEIMLSPLYPGDFFGWSSILGREAHSTKVIAEAKSTSYRIDRHKLYKLLNNMPDAGIMIIECFAEAIVEPFHNTKQFVFSILKKGLEIG